VILVGAAPISKACLDYFLSLNLPIMNVYGMSESTAPTSCNTNKLCSIYSAGYPVAGTEMVIKGPNNEILSRGTQGEICFRGRNKFMGYYKNEKATIETIDNQGYIHSGDKGYMDDAGFLFITGRFKELIITAGGENIPPVLIEDAVKERCKIVSNAFLVGDARKYLVMLVSLKHTGRPDGEPSGELAPEVVEALALAGVNVKTVAEAIVNKEVEKYVEASIQEVNKNSTSRAQEIKKFAFLPSDFSIPGGEMTPTLKVKRKFVQDKYKAIIESLYTEPKI
jgi:long-chain-fatty-acid--CoA ligase ACSBG